VGKFRDYQVEAFETFNKRKGALTWEENLNELL
jgi:hypothetical protein